jgi:hypothetical protein
LHVLTRVLSDGQTGHQNARVAAVRKCRHDGAEGRAAEGQEGAEGGERRRAQSGALLRGRKAQREASAEGRLTARRQRDRG